MVKAMCSNERIILNLEAGGRAALNPRDIYSHLMTERGQLS